MWDVDILWDIFWDMIMGCISPTLIYIYITIYIYIYLHRERERDVIENGICNYTPN